MRPTIEHVSKEEHVSEKYKFFTFILFVIFIIYWSSIANSVKLRKSETI